jgi:hypothetical protein
MDTRSDLRRAVLDLRAAHPRGRFAPVVRVGRPAGRYAEHPAAPPPDHGAATDLVAALLRRAGDDPLTWLVRPGELTAHDLDPRWSTAARAACEEAGLPFTFVVVTRSGWWEPATGERRTWRRLRDRSVTGSAP